MQSFLQLVVIFQQENTASLGAQTNYKEFFENVTKQRFQKILCS